MSLLLLSLLFVLAVPTALAQTPAAALAGVQPPPGTVIEQSNADRFARFIPDALMPAIRHGLRIKVMPTTRLDWSAAYQRATEKYSPQARLDDQDLLQNYVAGLPFPLIDPKDPKAAPKIAYDWALGPFTRDDNVIQDYNEDGFAFDLGQAGKIRRDASLDHKAAEIDFLRYAHRAELQPIPALPNNSLGFEWKLRVTGWQDFSHTDCSPGFDPFVDPYSSITLRYLDPGRPDESYMVIPGSRRLIRLGYEALPDVPSHLCWYPYWQPKIGFYRFRLLGNQPILALVNVARESVTVKDGQLGEVPAEIRPAYILEVIPREAEHARPQQALIYIDAEVFLELALQADGTADEGSGVSEIEIPFWNRVPSSAGGSAYAMTAMFYQGQVSPPASLPRSISEQVKKDWNSSFWWVEVGKQTFNTGKVDTDQFNPRELNPMAH